MSGLREHLEDLFAPLGGVSFRRMFGGLGVFRDGLMFGLVSGDVLYMKADEETRGRYEAEGAGPFTYASKKGAVSLPYWRLPERLLEEPDEFAEWAIEASQAAVRRKKGARPRAGTTTAAKTKAPAKGRAPRRR